MRDQIRETHNVVQLKVDQIPQAAAVLTRAFQDSPVQHYVFPDPQERMQLMPALFRSGIRFGQLAGEVWTTIGEVLGVAVWLPLGQGAMAPVQWEQAGTNDLPSLIGIDAFGRFTQYLAYLQTFHERAVSTPHWYLSILGIDPPYQGKGIGSSLLRPMLAHADNNGLPCYLETVQPKTVPFYRKHGFELVVEDIEPSSGVRFWTLRRDPR
jgi:GNAT superfamily N-acetyltransferase